MLDTEGSSSDTDADWRKLESKNPYLRLMALGKTKNTMNQYLLQDIDGLDVKLLFGVYQRKVLGYEERIEVIPDILDKILDAKKQAKQLFAAKNIENQDKAGEALADEKVNVVEEIGAPKIEIEKLDKSQAAVDKFAKNDPSLKPKEKEYLAQFIIKPQIHVNESVTTNVQPSPLDIGNAQYVDNPIVMTNLSPRQAEALGSGYNLSFEPYTSKYPKDSERLRGQRRSSNHSNPDEKSNMDLKFEFAGPRRGSDERQYFKTVQESYQQSIRIKKDSLADLVEDGKRKFR